ncbi:hypothetical protein bmyco0003_57410 [Bacillus pseudomycoides]|nr:hypothetical protein bmyco0003_57410 [Bacillus pseudomycoides]
MEAKKHLVLANDYLLISNIYELWSYYDISLEKEKNVTYLNAVGNQYVQAKNLSHMTFMDKRVAKMTSDAYREYIQGITYQFRPILPPAHYNSSNEKTSGDFLMRYLNIDNLNFLVNNIPISILLRAYTVIEEESKKFLVNSYQKNIYMKNDLNKICLVLSGSKWRKKFESAGIPNKYSKKVIEFLIFSKQSNDLFDCPFIKFEDKLLVVPSINLNLDASRAIILNANSNQINLASKGYTFEKIIADTLKKRNIKCISEKKHNQGETYECDAIFNIEETLYFVEIKNWTIPTTYKEYAYYLDDISKTISQHERTVEFYLRKENLDEILKQLDFPSIKRTKKLILTNVSLGLKALNSDTYLLDDTMFRGYFNRNSPKIVEKKNLSLSISSTFTEFYEGEITDQQFNTFIESVPFLDHQKDRLEEIEFNSTLKLNIKLKDYGFRNLYIKKE